MSDQDAVRGLIQTIARASSGRLRTWQDVAVFAEIHFPKQWAEAMEKLSNTKDKPK